MASSKRARPQRYRVGRVSYYQHHGSWYVYYRDNGKPVRRRVGASRQAAEQIAAEVNAQVTAGVPSMFAFNPVSVPELCHSYLEHHEYVLRSSLATVTRYRSALRHLEVYAAGQKKSLSAHAVQAGDFARYLRSTKVAPNGHAHSKQRKLRDKGVSFILETCRSLYAYAAKQRHLPPYTENPFAGVGKRRAVIEDAKAVFVFDAATELKVLSAADSWSFPIHFTLAKTGIRPGELVHLLIEDLDLDGGWLHVRNKPELDWRIKTRRERSIPLVPGLQNVLRCVIRERTAGPVFLRQRYASSTCALAGASRRQLAATYARRLEEAEDAHGEALSRAQRAKIARSVWRDAGAIKADAIRNNLIQLGESVGVADLTCPKSWRHTFATLLQDANVDPLVRQLTLGHSPTTSAYGGSLGMTTTYTHTRPETLQREIVRALKLWPDSLELAREFVARTNSPDTKNLAVRHCLNHRL